MKNNRQETKKNGFTIVEMIIVMVIVAVILSAVIAVGQGATDTSRITSTVSTIKAIQTAAVNYYNANGGTFTSGTLASGNTLSLANLASNGFLPTKIVGINAWGGTIAVAPDTTAAYFDITLTKVPATPGNVTANTSGIYPSGSIAAAVSNSLQTAPTYTASSQSWQAAF